MNVGNCDKWVFIQTKLWILKFTAQMRLEYNFAQTNVKAATKFTWVCYIQS